MQMEDASPDSADPAIPGLVVLRTCVCCPQMHNGDDNIWRVNSMQASGKRLHAITSTGEIRRFFAARAKRVISFAGFGELGYQDDGVVARVAEQVLGSADPDKILANGGTLLRSDGQNGIGEIYRIAKAFGIETSGIHPSVALDFLETHHPSPFCDHVHYVEDDTWGGFLAGTREMSPTLRIVLEVTDELMVIGGGKHAADELEAFVEHNKTVRYFPAEMNHEATREWCARSGAWIPDFRGDAHNAWLRLLKVPAKAAYRG
jgi:hypothetical protein